MQPNQLKGPVNEFQYQDFRVYAKGGMGEVYLARDTVNNIDVIVKRIPIVDSTEKKLLEEEFKIASSLQHKNLVKTFYYGEYSDNSGEYFYSVMEYCSGGNLDKRLKDAPGLISLENCLKYFDELLDGTEALHKHIIHRDLKPLNILVDAVGILKICDFGIAKYVDHLTRSKTLKGYGSMPYMAPECWYNSENTPRMDIYSLGIIFFEILTLRKPYEAGNESDYRSMHLYSPLPDLRKIRSDTPIAIQTIVERMVNKNPSGRFDSATSVKEALGNFMVENADKSNLLQPLLDKVNDKMIKLNNAKLEQERIDAEIIEFKTGIEHEINTLFNQIESIIERLNRSLDQVKFHINKKNSLQSQLNFYSISFMNKKIDIVLFSSDLLLDYDEWYKKRQRSLQIKNHGRLISEPVSSFIKKDKLVAAGSITTNILTRHNRTLGANIILTRDDEALPYGEWHICRFVENIQYSNVIDDGLFYGHNTLNDFIADYESHREGGTNFTHMVVSKLVDKDIVELLMKMID